MGIRILGLLTIAISLLLMGAELEYLALFATAWACFFIHHPSLSGVHSFSYGSTFTQQSSQSSASEKRSPNYLDPYTPIIGGYDAPEIYNTNRIDFERVHNPAYSYLSENVNHDHSSH